MEQNYDQPPVNQNGRVLVPLRGIFESLDAEVDWNYYTQEINATKGDTKVWLKIGSDITKVNGKSTKIDVPAQLINRRTLVPLRLVGEALGADVSWNPQTRSVSILKPIVDTITYSSGFKYVGEVKNGLPNGNGKQYDPNGYVSHEGYFLNGKLNGFGKEYNENGQLAYEGEWKDGKANGYGKAYTYSDGTLSWMGEGIFGNNLLTGYGTLFDRNGNILSIGQFIDGELIDQVNNVPTVEDPAPIIEDPTLIDGELFLYAQDGTYLGKLTTDSYDSESIFNEFGTYGSKFSSKSAFNEYASSPPLVIFNGETIGYLTVNKYQADAISPYGLYESLLELGL